MSIMYCEKHDRRWDSDFLEVCPLCENEPECIRNDMTESQKVWQDAIDEARQIEPKMTKCVGWRWRGRVAAAPYADWDGWDYGPEKPTQPEGVDFQIDPLYIAPASGVAAGLRKALDICHKQERLHQSVDEKAAIRFVSYAIAMTIVARFKP